MTRVLPSGCRFASLLTDMNLAKRGHGKPGLAKQHRALSFPKSQIHTDLYYRESRKNALYEKRLDKVRKIANFSSGKGYKLSKVSVVFYCDEDGKAPFVEWFSRLPEKVKDKCLVRIERLRELGYQLKRPEADYLRDDVYELRIKHQSVNYRVLYFFHGRQLVVLSHGFVKQRASVPEKEILRAVKRIKKFEATPSRHTYKE